MKIILMFSFMISAAALSIIAVLVASGRLNAPVETAPVATNATAIVTVSAFPEQSRAVEDLLKAINAREAELDRQKLQLDERAAKLQQQEILVKRMHDELTATKTAIAEHFNQSDADETANTRKLAEFYAKMEAESAASLLLEMETDQAARIISVLADRQAGAIMNATVATGERGIERAVAWTETIRKQKQERAAAKKDQ